MLFGVILPQKQQKTLKKHSLGHSEPGAQKHSKSTPWGTFWPGPLSTPVNGGRDRNPMSVFLLRPKHLVDPQALFTLRLQHLEVLKSSFSLAITAF